MKEKCILGLDISITSVGWSVIGVESHEILNAGVRMFPSADSSMNQTRKNYRGMRRNNRRQQNRLSRLDMYLKEYGYCKPVEHIGNPIDLRVKGLSEKLDREELYIVLYHLTKYRGVSYLEDMKDVKVTDILINNLNNMKHQHPCQIQKQRWDIHGVFRGTNMIEGETFINTFTMGMYEEEISAIFKFQKKYHKELTEEFINGFLQIYRSKREYYIGPGNELSRTNYGVYKTNGTTLEYLYDEFRGACSIYNGKHGMDKELRASAASYSVQYYNVLNDLCNIKVDGKKLTEHQKIQVMKLLQEYKLGTTITKALKKLYGIQGEQVTGYRIDKNNKENNHSFHVYRSMRKDLALMEIDINNYSIKALDAIADILTLNIDTDTIIAHLKNKDREEYKMIGKLSAKEIKAFVKLKQNRSDLFTRWSSFSYRILDILVPEMLESGEEQYTCIKRLGIRSKGTICKNKIDYHSIVDEIYNPAVSRAVIQAIKIVNQLFKEYDFAEVILEMPKDNSLEEEKTNIAKLQKKNENLRMMALSFAGIKESQIDTRKDRRIIQKLKLYYQQRGRCLYSGRKINLDKLLDGTFDYEVDHIIPMSVSFDDSMANKVLVEAQQNRKKSNMTPYNYLNHATDSWSYKEYKAFVLGLRRDRLINDTKKENFLMEQDIKKEDIIKTYINRNTNDTRYASKVISNELNRFFSGNNKNIKVKVINPAITNQLKKATFGYNKKWKDEYENYAYNAMICCFTALSLQYYHDKYVNIETGQILDKNALETLDNEEKAGYLLLSGWDVKNKMIKYRDQIKISHKIDTKVNRLISDQTIYGTRKVDGHYYTVHKIKDIYDNKEFQRLKKKLPHDKTKFLMYQNDIKTWEKLEEIIALYPNIKGSPFKEHMDKVGPLRKYAKKNNGPIITELKYLGNRIGKGIDITHKYHGAKNKVVMESLKQFRGDVYYDTKECHYNIVPIRYADFKIIKNEYVLTDSNYEKLLKTEGLLEEKQEFKDLKANGHNFCYSLYRNSIIGIQENTMDNAQIKYYRYYGKNHSMKNRFEYKNIYGNDVSRKYITLSNRIKECNKYNVDILGNYYKVQKEKLKLRFPLDNQMIDQYNGIYKCSDQSSYELPK